MSSMQSHIAIHQQRVALFALPNSTGLEEGSDVGSAEADAGNVSGETDMSQNIEGWNPLSDNVATAQNILKVDFSLLEGLHVDNSGRIPSTRSAPDAVMVGQALPMSTRAPSSYFNHSVNRHGHIQNSHGRTVGHAGLWPGDQCVIAHSDYIGKSYAPLRFKPLRFAPGEVIVVLCQAPTGWWYGARKGHLGWFPSSYVSPASSDAVESFDGEHPTNFPPIIVLEAPPVEDPPNWAAEFGLSGFFTACLNGNKTNINTFLRERPESANMLNDAGDTPLHIVAPRGYVDIVLSLLSQGAETDSRNRTQATPLMGAVENGQVEVVRGLLSHGANAQLQDSRGHSPLEFFLLSTPGGPEVRSMIRELLVQNISSQLLVSGAEKDPDVQSQPEERSLSEQRKAHVEDEIDKEMKIKSGTEIMLRDLEGKAVKMTKDGKHRLEQDLEASNKKLTELYLELDNETHQAHIMGSPISKVSRIDTKFNAAVGHRSPTQKTMLSKALAKANSAVLLDNAENTDGAIEAYVEACDLLQEAMLRSSDPEDKKKLSAIRGTYSNRITELLAGYSLPSLMDKALPEAQMTGTAKMLAPGPAESNVSLYPWSRWQLPTFGTGEQSLFPRYGAGINNFASKDGDVYILGGLTDGSTVRGDVWLLNTKARTCAPLPTISEGPGPRVGHAALLVGNAFIVMGGDSKLDEGDKLDTTLYLLNTSSRQWSHPVPSATPPPRYGHSMCIIGSCLYLFGGQEEGTMYNDTWRFDLNNLADVNNVWEKRVQSLPPPARTNHTAVAYRDEMWIFGGTDGATWYNDIWKYNPKQDDWTMIKDMPGYIPASREGHSSAVVGDVMYIFGGRTEEGNDLGDLGAYTFPPHNRWYTFQNMGLAPSPRSGHTMTVGDDGTTIVVMGGEPSSAPRDEAELQMIYELKTDKIRYPDASEARRETPAVPLPMAEQAVSPQTVNRWVTDAIDKATNEVRDSEELEVPRQNKTVAGRVKN